MKKTQNSKVSFFLVLLVLLLLAGLPVAVWLDLSDLADTNLRRQAADLNSVISSMRGYYATNVVGRVLAYSGTTKVVHNYQDIEGAIPIPATLSLELGKVISEQQQNITYRFVSDYPFKNRPAHALDQFETDALTQLRQNSSHQLAQVHDTIFSDSVRLIAPVIMGQACVNCHNSHPESPKLDWKVGDVRGIQEVAISQPIGRNIFAFKHLLAYFVLIATVGTIFIALQRRQAAVINGMNVELEAANEFLASLSIASLNAKWRSNGVEHPFRVRMGVNTGFCNVGNFGSNDRMDYTITGAEANLAARLQAIAEPGQIVISYETYAFVRDTIVARALPPITMKGISREVIPYVVSGVLDATGKNVHVFSEHMTGMDFYFNASMIDSTKASHIREILQDALKALDGTK